MKEKRFRLLIHVRDLNPEPQIIRRNRSEVTLISKQWGRDYFYSIVILCRDFLSHKTQVIQYAWFIQCGVRSFELVDFSKANCTH